MRFAVQVRRDHATKLGGDTALAMAFLKRITCFGHQAELVSAPKDLLNARFDWLIAFNLDQPLELLALARAAKSSGIKVAVYALHHPAAGVRAYLSSTLSGIRGLVARMVAGDPERYFYMMAIARGLVRFDRLAIYYAMRSQKQLLLDTALLIDQILVSGPSEADSICQDLPMFCGANFFQVSHPIDFGGALSKFQLLPVKVGRRFLIAGRIESRKNPCAILDVAASFPDDEFIFAGLFNQNERNYTRMFEHKLSLQSNCYWVGQLDIHELISEIASANAVISPSWFEVMSLINLYSYALGTKVISSAYSYDGDVLGQYSCHFYPNKPVDLEYTIRNLDSTAKPEIKLNITINRAEEISKESWIGFDKWLTHIH